MELNEVDGWLIYAMWEAINIYAILKPIKIDRKVDCICGKVEVWLGNSTF